MDRNDKFSFDLFKGVGTSNTFTGVNALAHIRNERINQPK
jgi:hypothetical protein